MFLQILQQQLEFAHLLPPSVGINRQQHGQHQNPHRQRPQMIRQSFQPLPRQHGKSRRQQNHEQQNPSPKLRFFPLQISWRARPSRTIGRGLRHEEVIWFFPQRKWKNHLYLRLS